MIRPNIEVRRSRVPSPPARLAGAAAVFAHRLLAARVNWLVALLTTLITPLTFTLAIGVGLGWVVTDALGTRSVNGLSYTQYVLPALLVNGCVVLTVEQLCYYATLGFRWNPTFVAMGQAPLGTGTMLAGTGTFVAFRAAAVAAVYWVLGLTVGAWRDLASAVSIPIGVLTGLALGLPVMAYALTLTTERGQVQYIMRFVVTPLVLFSGTFFPIDSLPGLLSEVMTLSPVWRGVELVRHLSRGDDAAAAIHVAYLVVLAATGAFVARRTLKRRLAL